MGTPHAIADLAALLGGAFIQRRDAVAQQVGEGDSQHLPTGAYRPMRERVSRAEYEAGIKGPLIPWRKSLIREHLSGVGSYGHYLLDLESKTRILAFDVDFDKVYNYQGQDLEVRKIFGGEHPAAVAMTESIRCVADSLAFRLKREFPNLTVCCSFSGSKGIHVYGLLDEPVPGCTAKGMILDVIANSPVFERGKSSERHKPVGGSDVWWRPVRENLPIGVEVFPKQEVVNEGGFGNLMGLPLGYNLKTRRAKFFYDPHSDPRTITPIDPFAAISQGITVK